MSMGNCNCKGSPQALVDQRPVFDNGHPRRRTVFSRKGGVYRPTKKFRKPKFM